MSYEIKCQAIFNALHEVAAHAPELLQAALSYAICGGKCARGLLLLVTGEGLTEERVLLQAAACLELLHAATLVQDDVFDGSRLRRGRPATHVLFGWQTAILLSDWMLAEAIRWAYRLHPAFGEALSTCAQSLIDGVVRELGRGKGDAATLREHALRVARGKTGELFGLALSAGSLLAGDHNEAMRLHRCGVEIGVAFQYLDDLLDMYGEASIIGKEVGCDRRAALLTLPMLDASQLLMPGMGTRALALESPEVQAWLEARARQGWSDALLELGEVLAADGDRANRVTRLLGSLAAAMLPGEDKTARSAAA